jgi:hypothetical protein
LARLANRHRRPGGRRPLPLDGTEQGRAREGPGFKLNFLKILNRNLKNFKLESCKEFENLRLSFWVKVHLSFSLEVILNLRIL